MSEHDIGQVLKEVYQTVWDRKSNMPEGSYTAYLYAQGQDKILKKIGEEAAEVIIASKNNQAEEIIYEIADLTYHVIVLLGFHNLFLEDIARELAKRRK